MSRLPALHAVLAGLVATTALACSCPEPEEETIVIDPNADAIRQALERCELDANDCEDLCSKVYSLMHGPGSAEYQYFTECELVDYDGMPAVHYVTTIDCVGGRRPAGVDLGTPKSARSAAGSWFADLAELEEASVYAFVWLGKELSRLDAPPSLVQRCNDAAADEIRHAYAVSRLAERFGAELSPAPIPALPAGRTLLEVAIENAREGCVRETYGALIAVWQSAHSTDAVVRSIMAQVAIDESRHAELSRDIDNWARSVLDMEACSALDSAKKEAVITLRRTCENPVCAELVAQAGLPDSNTAQQLFEHAEQQLWS